MHSEGITGTIAGDPLLNENQDTVRGGATRIGTAARARKYIGYELKIDEGSRKMECIALSMIHNVGPILKL